MSSEIRTGSTLAPSAAKSGPAELSLQNPLFNIGGQDGFSQVLKQQVGARDESRRPSQSEQGVKSSDTRRETKADSRQDSGKSLPERSARDADARVERPAARKPADNQQRDEAENTQAATNAGAQPPTDPRVSQQPKAAEGDSAVPASQQVQAEAQAAAAQVVTDATMTAEESVLAELAALQAEAEGGDLASPTDPSTVISAEAGLTTEGEAEAADAAGVTELDLPELATDPESAGGKEIIDAAIGSEKPQGESVSGNPLQAQMSALSPSPHIQDTAAAPGGAEAKQAATAQAGSTAPKAADVVTTMTPSAAEGSEPVAEGELAAWELGHEPTAAEKNAEKNTDLTRQLATNSSADRTGPLKEQLAALAQQFKGDTESRNSKPGASKTEAATDIKATAFGRSLEQLSNARVDSAKPVSTGIQTLVGQREWASEMGQRLMMMVSSKLKSAEIHLNPKDLGPVEVRIRMHEDKAHVVFTSQVAQTREALEQAVPRLREMFDQNGGVGLGSVDVQDQGARHSHQQEQASDGRQNGTSDVGGSLEAETGSDSVPVRMIGLVDYYA